MTAFFSKRVIATIDLQQLNYAQLNNPYKTKCYAHNEIKKKRAIKISRKKIIFPIKETKTIMLTQTGVQSPPRVYRAVVGRFCGWGGQGRECVGPGSQKYTDRTCMMTVQGRGRREQRKPVIGCKARSRLDVGKSPHRNRLDGHGVTQSSLKFHKIRVNFARHKIPSSY